MSESRSPTDSTPLSPTPSLRGLTAEDIESWKALNVAVCIRSRVAGEVWVVPHYTGLPRKEITAEHVATLSRFLALFPGSELARFDLSNHASTNRALRAPGRQR